MGIGYGVQRAKNKPLDFGLIKRFSLVGLEGLEPSASTMSTAQGGDSEGRTGDIRRGCAVCSSCPPWPDPLLACFSSSRGVFQGVDYPMAHHKP